MKDKYYTPSIEEFHVGLEFEFRGVDNNWVPTEWEKHKVSSEETKPNVWQPNLKMIQKLFNIKEISTEQSMRIKYLDAEDIESLGFKYIKDGWGDESKIFRSNRKEGYEIYHRGLGSCHITNSCGSVLFDGTAKNKSELEKLLKQLDIP